MNLVENGIFPIVFDKHGNKLPTPDTGLQQSGTIQGEGKLAGTLCLFIRTTACNLRCAFGKNLCDTPYSSFFPENEEQSIEDIVRTIELNSRNGLINHVVISGGEPTLQTKELGELLIALKVKGYHTTIETNATIISDVIVENTDLISMSPKLSSSNPSIEVLQKNGIGAGWARKHASKRYSLSVISAYVNYCRYNPEHDYQLKFVVTCEDDIQEIINDYVIPLELTPQEYKNVYLMPEGITEQEVIDNGKKTANLAVQYGFSFTSRLHTLIWGTKAGV